MKLNLGCFNAYKDGWVNLDITGECDVTHDVTVIPWPFQDGEFEHIRAHDLLEHLPVGSFAPFMNECHRVLQDGGLLDIVVPAPSDNFWLDPTHVRPYPAELFNIFCMGGYETSWMGLKAWSQIQTRPLSRPQVPASRILLVK